MNKNPGPGATLQETIRGQATTAELRERRDGLGRGPAPGLHQLPGRHCERRRPGAGDRERRLTTSSTSSAHASASPQTPISRLLDDASRGDCRRTTRRGAVMSVPAPSGCIGGRTGGVLVMVAICAAGADAVRQPRGRRRQLVRAQAPPADAGGRGGARCRPRVRASRATTSRSSTRPPHYSGGTVQRPGRRHHRADVHMLINSSTYFNQSSPVDDTVVTGAPCSAKMVDVKLTETDLPWYFGLAQVPFINAHARVVDPPGGHALGLAADRRARREPECCPGHVRRRVHQPADGARVARPDASTGTANGLSDLGQQRRTAAGDGQHAHIGVRVALGGGTSTDLRRPAGRVLRPRLGERHRCTRAAGRTPAAAAQPNPPLARGVTLVQRAPAPTPTSRRRVELHDRGARQGRLRRAEPARRSERRLTASVGGNNYPLTYDAATGTWQSAASIPIAAGAGPVPVELEVGGDDRHRQVGGKRDLQDRQREQVQGHVRHGPAHLRRRLTPLGADQARADLGERLVLGELVRALQRRPDAVHARPGREDRPPGQPRRTPRASNDPIVALRVAGGSQNQSLDCDPDVSRTSRTSSRTAAGRPTRRTPAVRLPGDRLGAVGHSASRGSASAIQTGERDEPGAGGDEPAHPRQREADHLHRRRTTGARFRTCLPATRGSCRSSSPLRVASAAAAATIVPVTGFATFYVTGWTGHGRRLRQPMPGERRRPGPEQRRRLHRRPFHQVRRHAQRRRRRQRAVRLRRASARCVAVLTGIREGSTDAMTQARCRRERRAQEGVDAQRIAGRRAGGGLIAGAFLLLFLRQLPGQRQRLGQPVTVLVAKSLIEKGSPGDVVDHERPVRDERDHRRSEAQRRRDHRPGGAPQNRSRPPTSSPASS